MIDDKWGKKDFETSKHIVISESSFFGGKEPALGIMFLIGGAFCAFLCILMIILGFARWSYFKSNPR